MALSPTAPWREACLRGSARLRFLLEIDDDTNTWTCMDGSSDVLSYPVAIKSISGIASETDPLLRTPSASQLTVEVSDAWLRPILVNNRLKGQKATVKLGAAELAEVDFLTVFIGPMESFEPRDGLSVAIEIVDVFTLLERAEVTGAWIGKHPLQVIEDIANRAKITSTYIDTDSFDPAHADNLAIGEYVISRGGDIDYLLADNSVATPVNALELIGEVARLINGQFVSREDGKLKFVRFDASAAAAGAWTHNHILPGSFRQTEVDDNVINRVLVKFSSQYGAYPEQTYQADDTASQANYAYPDTTSRVLSHEFTTDWLETAARLNGGITDVATSMEVGGPVHMFSGTREIAGSQPAEANLDASQPGYFLLWDIPSETGEIVKVTAMSMISREVIQIRDPETLALTPLSVPVRLNCSTIVREQFGTTKIAHPAATPVYDVTILVALSDALLKRFKDGAPVVELRTPLSEVKFQAGDLMTLVIPEFLSYSFDGLDGTQKFEIVGKELDPFGSPPSIRWSLVYAADVALTRTATGFGARESFVGKFDRANTSTDLMLPHVLTGYEVTGPRTGSITAFTDGGGGDVVVTSAGHEIELGNTLTISGTTNYDGTYTAVNSVTSTKFQIVAAWLGDDATGTWQDDFSVLVTAGIASNYPATGEMKSDQVFTVTASKDTYMTANSIRGTITGHEVATGASLPTTLLDEEALIAKVIAGAAAITSINDPEDIGVLVAALRDTANRAPTISRERVVGSALNFNSGMTLYTRK